MWDYSLNWGSEWTKKGLKNYNNAFRKVIIVRKLLSEIFFKQNYEIIDLVNGVRSLHLDIHGHEEGEEEENPAGQSQ